MCISGREKEEEWEGEREMYLDYADDNVLQARPFRVVVQQQFAILFRAAKRGRPHARIQGAQMVVQGVQILFVCVFVVVVFEFVVVFSKCIQ